MTEYRYRTGSRFNVPAQVVGEEIASIEAIQGRVTPQAFVDRARPEGSPLHPSLEWRDDVAAEKFRLEQARHLIRSVHPVHLDAAGHPTPVLGWVHVDLPDAGPCYVSTARAVSDPELQAQVERDAIRAFEALRHRYGHIVSLKGLFAAVDRAASRAKKAVPARPARQPRREEAIRS